MATKEITEATTEVLKIPLSSVGETVERLVALVARITDLDDAQKALDVAKLAYKNGKVEESKDLVTQIFARLQDLGKAPKGLDAISVQEHLQAGHAEKIEEMLKEQVKGGKGGVAIVDTDVEAVFKNLPKMFVKDEMKPGQTPAEVATAAAANKASLDAKKDINAQITTKKTEVDTREQNFLKELEGLMDNLSGSTKLKTDVQLQIKEMRQWVDEGWTGTTRIEEQIKALKTKLESELLTEDGKNIKDVDQLLQARKKSKTGGFGVVAKTIDNLKGDQIQLYKLGNLVSGLNKVQEASAKGLDLKEATRTILPEEIAELRKFLSSGEEILDVDKQPLNYDPMYAELNKRLSTSFTDSERAAAFRLVQAVDVNYSEMKSNQGVDQEAVVQRRQRSTQGRAADMDVDRDERGNPRVPSGVEYMSGAANHQNLENIYVNQQDRFKELYEELPGGGYVPKGLDKQLAEAHERALEYDRQRSLLEHGHREAFVNVDMKSLGDYIEKYDNDHPGEPSLLDMLDKDYYLKYKVTKLKEEVMRDKSKLQYFEKWWIQEKLHETRMLAYEGQFEKRQGSTRMIRYNSLDEIVGISTAVKGYSTWMAMSFNVIDQQNNAYVNQELMGKLNAFWTNQGVDFRLDNMLKLYREEICLFDNITGDKGKKIGDISMYDTVSFLQKDITDPKLREELGIPEWRDIKFGTMVYKYSNSKKRDNVRGIVWKYFAKSELGIDWDNPEQVPADQKDRIMNMYQNMFDLAFNFATSHKLLNTMIGDSSFTKEKVELPGAAAEMHLKLDPLLYSRLFVPRFNWLNKGFKELWFLFDPGVRDYVAMARQDYAGQYTTFDVKKYKEWKVEKNSTRKADLAKDLTVRGLEGENGAWTIMSGMLGGYDKTKAESFGGSQIEAAFELQQVFDKALWHWGAKAPGHGHSAKETDIMFELGVSGEASTAYRRSTGKIIKILSENQPSNDTLKLIDWKKYCDIVQNPRIEKYLTGDHSLEEKWQFFAKTFGEGSFDHSSASTKRPGDHTLKYSLENYNKYVESFLKWMDNPYDRTNDDALNEVPRAVNAPSMRPLQIKRFNVMKMLAEKMGRSELLGGSGWRLFTDPDTNETKFDTSQGIGEDGDNQLPAYQIQEIKNNRSLLDPIQNRSIANSRGVGTPQDPNWWMDWAKGLYAEGVLSENDYKRIYKELVNGVWVEPKLGFIGNTWRWVNGAEPFFEWLAPQFGLTAHELKHILSENAEKTASNFLKYLNS